MRLHTLGEGTPFWSCALPCGADTLRRSLKRWQVRRHPDVWVNAIAPEGAVPRKPLVRKHWLSKGRLLEDGKSYVMSKLDDNSALSYSRDTREKVRAGTHLGRQAGPTLDLFDLAISATDLA